MGRDSRSLTEARYHQIEDCDEIPDDQRDKVRRLCASQGEGLTFAEQRADAEELMKALGVHPSQEHDQVYLTGPRDIPTSIMGIG